jgi:hypothetical protein
MLYCVVRVGKGQGNGILCGEGWERAVSCYVVWWGVGEGRVMLCCGVRGGIGGSCDFLCGGGWAGVV